MDRQGAAAGRPDGPHRPEVRGYRPEGHGRPRQSRRVRPRIQGVNATGGAAAPARTRGSGAAKGFAGAGCALGGNQAAARLFSMRRKPTSPPSPRQGHWRPGWTGLAPMSRTSIPCPAPAWKSCAPRPNIFCRFRRMTASGTRTNRSGATWDGSTISAGSTNGTESRAAATSAGCGAVRRLLKVAANLRPRTGLPRKS